MRRALRSLLFALSLALPGVAHSAGTTPLALVQQSDINGQPLAGCLLYFYVAGTVATPQNSFADFGLTTQNPNPLACDATGRVPMHWLADGLIHIRLTDAGGNVIIDNTLQTLGPSSGGGGGGGGTVDPTSVASTGDIKFRPTSETLSGWVILNGTTIGSAASGATQRANSDTQNLFVYLWQNCTNAHCPVPGGRGASALADFNANKQITLLDMRDSIPVGRDCMGATCAGGLLSSNVTSGGGDGVDTPAASGGAANPTLTQNNLPNLTWTGAVNIPAGQGSHSHSASFVLNTGTGGGGQGAPGNGVFFTNESVTVNASGLPAMTGTATINSGGANSPFAVMNPFKLGTWYMKI